MLLRGETFQKKGSEGETSNASETEPALDLFSSPLGSKLLHRKMQHQKLRRDFELQRWLALRMQQDDLAAAIKYGVESEPPVQEAPLTVADYKEHFLCTEQHQELFNRDDVQTEANLDAINASIDRLIIRMDAHIDAGNSAVPSVQKVEIPASVSKATTYIPQESLDTTAKSKNLSKQARKRLKVAEKRKQRKQKAAVAKGDSKQAEPHLTVVDCAANTSNISIPGLSDSLLKRYSDAEAPVGKTSGQSPAVSPAKHLPFDLKVAATDEAEDKRPLHAHLNDKHSWLKQWILKQNNAVSRPFVASPMHIAVTAVPPVSSATQSQDIAANCAPDSPLRFPLIKVPELTCPHPQNVTNPFDVGTPEPHSFNNPFDRYDFSDVSLPHACPATPASTLIASQQSAATYCGEYIEATDKQTPLTKGSIASAGAVIETDVDSEEEAELADRGLWKM